MIMLCVLHMNIALDLEIFRYLWRNLFHKFIRIFFASYCIAAACAVCTAYKATATAAIFNFVQMFDQKMHDKYALHFVVYVARIDQGLDNRIVRRSAKNWCITL